MTQARLAAVTVLVTLAAAPAIGQVPLDAIEGATVRVQTIGTGDRWIKGRLVELDSTALTLQATRSRTVLLDRARVSRIEVSVGHGRAKGAGIGFLVGLFVAGVFTLSGSDSDFCSGSGCYEAFVLFGVPAAAVGAGVGAAVAQERWLPVSMTAATPSPSVAKGRFAASVKIPPGGGIGAAVSCRF